MTQAEHPSGGGGQRPTWGALLAAGGPLLLPAAHDALTARLIARAGFRAYPVGGSPRPAPGTRTRTST